MLKPDLTTLNFHQCFVEHFHEHIRSNPKEPNSYLIAYSGGLDSYVLLHLCALTACKYFEINLRCIYIDHGLQEASKGWGDHCEQVAANLGVDYQSVRLDLVVPAGESLEAVARKARYKALQEHLRENEVLMTAQHQDDQAETVLLQLLRGAGLDGLAAMPTLTPFGSGFHFRPLLEYSREQLDAYAKQNNLNYIVDPSNKDMRFDRNYLRSEVIPLLKQRWPQMGQTLSRSAGLQAEASTLLATFIEKEIPAISGSQPDTISALALNKLPLARQKAMLRYLIKQLGFKAPSAVKLQHVIKDILNSSFDSTPLVSWQEAEVRRYKDDVYIMKPLATLLPSESVMWDLKRPLLLGEGLPTLIPDDLGDLKNTLLHQGMDVSVRFRRGGERVRLKNRKHSISLKNFFQETEVPPWLRESLPLIYANDQLIYIPGLFRLDSLDFTM